MSTDHEADRAGTAVAREVPAASQPTACGAGPGAWRAGGPRLSLALAVALVWVVGFSPLLGRARRRGRGRPGHRGAGGQQAGRGAAGDSRWPGSTTRPSPTGWRQLATIADVSIERSWPSTLVIHASPGSLPGGQEPSRSTTGCGCDGASHTRRSTRLRAVLPMVNAAADDALSRDALLAAVAVLKVLPAPLQRQVTDVDGEQREPGHAAGCAERRSCGAGWTSRRRKVAIMTALLKSHAEGHRRQRAGHPRDALRSGADPSARPSTSVADETGGAGGTEPRDTRNLRRTPAQRAESVLRHAGHRLPAPPVDA